MALIAGVLALAILLAWGLSRSASVLIASLGPSHTSSDPRHSISAQTTSSPLGKDVDAEKQAAEDHLAAAPTPGPVDGQHGSEAATPAPVSTRDPGSIALPASRGSDVLGVLTGYPQTSAGAIAQLAGIDQLAMQSASLPVVREVIDAWAMPGGPTRQSWSGVKSMRHILDAATTSGASSGQMSISLTPAMGLVKGTIGNDFVVACVDFAIRVSLSESASSGLDDCQRMVWHSGRWMI